MDAMQLSGRLADAGCGRCPCWQLSFSGCHWRCTMEGKRIPAGNLSGRKGGASPGREASDCAGKSGIRSQTVRKGQKPSESSGSVHWPLEEAAWLLGTLSWH